MIDRSVNNVRIVGSGSQPTDHLTGLSHLLPGAVHRRRRFGRDG
jgi:hypothetical protein